MEMITMRILFLTLILQDVPVLAWDFDESPDAFAGRSHRLVLEPRTLSWHFAPAAHLLWPDQKQELGSDEPFGLLPAAYGGSREAERFALVNSAECSWLAAIGPVMVCSAGCFDSRTNDHIDLKQRAKHALPQTIFGHCYSKVINSRLSTDSCSVDRYNK